jgi:murein DD-endopeptidase MepM/ murein hydrolase activator NlpD
MDYKQPLEPGRRASPNLHWRLRWAALGIGCAVLGVVMAKTEPAAEVGRASLLLLPADQMQQSDLALPDRPQAPAEPPGKPNASGLEWTTLTVRSGDTLARLFDRIGVGREVIHALVRSGKAGERLNRIYPGNTIRVGLAPDGTVGRVEYEFAPEKRAVFSAGADGFSSRIVEDPLEHRTEYANGVIDSSLFVAGGEAGLTDRLIMELVSVFGWDIDFALDIRRGDRFSVVYESLFKNGERVRNGEIIAAEFVNQGRVYRAVRYTTADGDTDYYAPDGTSMRKAFLRTPVKFSRISSGFGKRLHPTLGTWRNHHGVDYAARTGTPIRATGDGRITYRGHNGGYGKFIEIRHGGRYSTAYAHMNGYARGTSVGSFVEQGDVIGYVGSTGRSTGPHLHYEFRVNGVHRNPLRVEFPSSDPVPEEQLDRFRQHTRPLLAQLDTLGRFYASLDR